MRRVLGWLVTPVFGLAFGGTLVVYDLAGRLALRSGLRRFEWTMASLQKSLVRVSSMCGVRVEVQRDPAVAENTAYLVISNHQSLLDPPLIGGILYTNLPKYVAKKELERGIPGISLNLRSGQHAIIDRDKPRQAVEEIIALGQRSQERGTSVVIFPEGTRAVDGHLKRFKRAGTLQLMAAAPDLPVLPISISGSWRFNHIPPYPVGERVKVRIGSPLARDTSDRDLFARAETWIREHTDPPVRGDDQPDQ